MTTGLQWSDPNADPVGDIRALAAKNGWPEPRTIDTEKEFVPMVVPSPAVTPDSENDSQVGPVENGSQVGIYGPDDSALVQQIQAGFDEIDLTPIPQPPVEHYLELDGDYGIRATLVCRSAPGAECRMVHDCACEEYCGCEPPSRMVDSGECNHANWVNADDASDEGASGTRILVPVSTAWESDHFEWTFIPGITK